MNLSRLVTRIKRGIGIYGIALPIDDIDRMILDILEDTTIPVFSIYSPFFITYKFDVSALECTQRSTDYIEYALPDFQERNLLYIANVTYDQVFTGGFGTWDGFGMPMNTPPMTSLSDIVTANAEHKAYSQVVPQLNFQFIEPNYVRLYNMNISSRLIFKIAFEHDSSGLTIAEMSKESFYKLALLDVKAGLYNTVKHYSNITTAYGNIELKIDDWQSAEETRASLLQEWDETYHLDMDDMMWS